MSTTVTLVTLRRTPLLCAVSWMRNIFRIKMFPKKFRQCWCMQKYLLFALQNNKTDKLCDANSGYGTLRCAPGYGSCPGSNGGNCWPLHVWSSTLIDGTSYYALYISSGMADASHSKLNDRYSTNAFSVRCVLDMNCFLQ